MEAMINERRAIFPAGARYCTFAQGAAYLGIGLTTLKKLVAQGVIETVHIGAGHRIVVASLDRYALSLEAQAQLRRAGR